MRPRPGYGSWLGRHVGMEHHGQQLGRWPRRKQPVTTVGFVSPQLLQQRRLSLIRVFLSLAIEFQHKNSLSRFLTQVFDIYQSLNVSYLAAQLFVQYTPIPSLAQLLSEGTLATVLNSTSSTPEPPLDTLTNTLVSPLFYGLQSTSVSNAQGLAALTGVLIGKNLPGAWTLQCGVDGVMMDTPVRMASPRLRDCSRHVYHLQN